MARKSGNKRGDSEVYKHDYTRKNAVPVGLASYDTSKLKPKKYEYDPHLATQLVWAGKAERTSFEVPTVFLHIHENIAPEVIIHYEDKFEILANSRFLPFKLGKENRIAVKGIGPVRKQSPSFTAGRRARINRVSILDQIF